MLNFLYKELAELSELWENEEAMINGGYLPSFSEKGLRALMTAQLIELQISEIECSFWEQMGVVVVVDDNDSVYGDD